jgi:hypothetical protein
LGVIWSALSTSARSDFYEWEVAKNLHNAQGCLIYPRSQWFPIKYKSCGKGLVIYALSLRRKPGVSNQTLQQYVLKIPVELSSSTGVTARPAVLYSCDELV